MDPVIRIQIGQITSGIVAYVLDCNIGVKNLKFQLCS